MEHGSIFETDQRASTDPDVMTIKITIYRLAKKTRLVEYLCAAAENGKEVTALIQLRAGVDEQNDIEWSEERMEEAGCRVLYGFEGYKVHSKICLITYRSRNGSNILHRSEPEITMKKRQRCIPITL